MRAEHLRVPGELTQIGALGEGYAPRPREIKAEHGWPGRELVGDDGAIAANRTFQRRVLALVEKVKQGKVRAQEAYRGPNRCLAPIDDIAAGKIEDPESMNERRPRSQSRMEHEEWLLRAGWRRK